MISQCIYINSVTKTMTLPWIFQIPLKSVGKAIAMKQYAEGRKIDWSNGELKSKLGNH